MTKKTVYVLEFDPPYVTKFGAIVNAVGPFDTMDAASQWCEANAHIPGEAFALVCMLPDAEKAT